MPRSASVLLAVALASMVVACGSGAETRPQEAGMSARESADRTSIGADARALHLVPVGSFDQPVFVTGAPGDASRVYVVQRTGAIALVLDGHKRSRAFLELGGLVNSGGQEQGLLGLAFPANYGQTGFFYIYYTTASNNIRVARYRRSARDPNVADPSSGRSVLTIEHSGFTNHNGGQLAFGREGDLYVGVGDGGSEGDPHGNGQNTSTLLGKILRIDPLPGGGYSVPPGNPFRGKPRHRAEIWAYGLRNPWRFSFDRQTGSLVIGDVGQDREEEIDFQPAGTGAGANYGWSIWEGNLRFKSGRAAHAIAPVLVAQHSNGYCAIIGGYVVRDRSLPSLYGRYLFGDFCHPQIESAKLSRGHASDRRSTGLRVTGTSGFGEDAGGHVYVASLDGAVYRIAEH